MTTISDLLDLPAIKEAHGRALDDTIKAFFNSFDKSVAFFIDYDIDAEYDVMSRISCDVLLHAGDGYGNEHFLGRLAFDRIPFALVRGCQTQNEDRDDGDSMTVVLTDRAVAEVMVDVIRDAIGRNDMREAARSDSVGDLLNFHRLAVIDIPSQSMRFQRTERLFALSTREPGPVCVLLRLEDGSFMLCERTVTGTVSHNHADGGTAAAALMAIVDRIGFEESGRISPFAILHGQDSINNVGLVKSEGGSLRCIVSGNGKQSEIDGDALQGFVATAQVMVTDVVATSLSAPGHAIR